MIIFDIETGALPTEQIQAVLPPFDASSVKHPGVFNASDVKLGNTTDPKKIEAKIEAAREKHQAAVDSYQEDIKLKEAEHWSGLQQRGALSAVTGQVVAIGYSGKKMMLRTVADGLSEEMLLNEFWTHYQNARKSNRHLVGFNIKQFDVPFLAQRSWTLGLEVPGTILTPTGYLDSTFVDLRDRWQCGNRFGGEKGFGTLDVVCRSLGLQTKPSNCTGAKFADMLLSDDAQERQAALGYLQGDLEMTLQLAQRLGVS